MKRNLIGIVCFIKLFIVALSPTYYAAPAAGDRQSIPDANLAAAIREVIGDSITTHTLLKLTQLHVPERGIRNLRGLEHARNLEYLWLVGNNISDISPLANLTKLEHLDLEGNDISDISGLTNLTNLTQLWLTNNNISDISGLANLTNLKYLDLRGNNITGISPLLGLNLSGTGYITTSNGTRIGLDIRGNPLNRASVEKHIPALQARGIVVEVDSPAHIKILREPPRNVSIPDANLAAAIREEIGSSITTHTLRKLIQLHASERGIRNLRGLEHARNLEYLDLRGNNITGISPLLGLNLSGTGSFLTSNGTRIGLDIRGNPLNRASVEKHIPALQARGIVVEVDSPAHIKILREPPRNVSIPDANLAAAIREEIGSSITTHTLRKLTQLHASERGIRNLRGLEHARNLEVLDLSYNNISDISGLTNLTNLKWLNLAFNNISDISGLTRLTNLETLGLYDNNISDISGLTNLTNLKWLNLAFNNISDISGLANLTNLKYLSLDSNNISDISVLAKLTQLESLFLYNNNISDISPLANLTKLETLSLYNNNISDISGLENLTKLETLSLSNNNISDISGLENLTKLKYLDLRGNNITGISPLLGLNLSGTGYITTSNGTRIGLDIRGNPLNRASVEKHIPALQARGIVVEVDSPAHIKILREPPRNVSIPDANLAAAIREEIGSSITTHTLLKLTQLDASVRGIRNLSGLEHARNLEVLDLWENNISDISGLTKLTNLKYLNLNYNDISDISGLTNLTDLTQLNLNYNDISDISGLTRLTNLETLGLSNNDISDISGLTNLTNLKYLNLWNNNITGISPLLGLNLPGGRLLTSNGTRIGLDIRGNPLNRASVEKHIPALQARGIVVEVDSPAHIKILREPPRNVSIPDANLAAAIREATREKIGSSITTHTLLKLKVFNPAERGIRNLGGLEHAHNLESLGLTFNNISDISPLANLTNLKSLSLAVNDISDISSLTNLTNLKSLSLDSNNISDISVLAKLTKLETLFLYNNNISDISPLANLTKLETLSLYNNNISDISPLANLTKLETLSLYNNNISDISVLENLTKLKALSLSNNNISDISPLLGLNLSGTERYTTGLYIRGNPLNRVSVEKHIPALQAKGITVSFDKPAQAAPVLLPKETLLHINYPNPFNPETWIPYQLAQPAEVTLRIYAPNGALVRALDLGHQPAGVYQTKSRAAHWDGKNELGERVASGLYFYTLTAGEFTATRKMLIKK